MKTDFVFANEGSIILLSPESPKALAWIDDNLPDDRTMFGKGIVIEHRFFRPIFTAIVMEGMSIEEY